MKIIINLDVLVLQVNRNDPFVLFPLLYHYLQPSISKNSVGVTEINYMSLTCPIDRPDILQIQFCGT